MKAAGLRPQASVLAALREVVLAARLGQTTLRGLGQIAELADISTVESPPRSEGRSLTTVLMPKPPKTGGKDHDKPSSAADKSGPQPARVRMQTSSKE